MSDDKIEELSVSPQDLCTGDNDTGNLPMFLISKIIRSTCKPRKHMNIAVGVPKSPSGSYGCRVW